MFGWCLGGIVILQVQYMYEGMEFIVCITYLYRRRQLRPDGSLAHVLGLRIHSILILDIGEFCLSVLWWHDQEKKG